MNEKLRSILMELRNRLSDLYGDRLADLILFGSQARGDAEEGSDIDVLVVLEGEVNSSAEIERTGGFVASICLQHDVVISCVFMDQEHYLRRNGPLLRNIRREGIAL